MPLPVRLKNNPAQRKSGYIPSLDGWRAIAIFGVMWTHDVQWNLARHSLRPFQNIGGAGVYLFFAISGILITTRILEEESLCGFFDIKRFYIRRIFRIQPASWLYLAVIGCLLALGFLHILWRHWFAALGMYENFIYGGTALDYQGFFVGHFWTLAVEEHFYVLLSLFLLLARKYRLAILGCLFWALLLFSAHASAHHALTELNLRRTYYQLPYLIYGACFAIALRKDRFRRNAERYLRPWIVLLFTVAFIVGREVWYHIMQPSPDDFCPSSFLGAIGFLSTFMFAVWIVSTMLHGNSLSTRFLELRPMRWVGRLSYSLYLWHLLFFSRRDPQVLVTLHALLAVSGRPAKYLAAFAAAALSYYFVEKPMMRLGHRLAPPATPGRPELIDDRSIPPANISDQDAASTIRC